MSTDRSTLLTRCALTEEFVKTFREKQQLLPPHSFIAMQQASFYLKCESNLQPGIVLGTADFSENCAFVLCHTTSTVRKYAI